MNNQQMQHQVYISLGSNMGDAASYLSRAVTAILALEGIFLHKISTIFETEPQGDRAQPFFFNQVAELSCSDRWSPEQLMVSFLDIESTLGRVRDSKSRFGPRCIDIDMLLFGDCVCNTSTVILPHPRMCERAFVLVPLCEIAPECRLPDGRLARQILENVPYSLTGKIIWQNSTAS